MAPPIIRQRRAEFTPACVPSPIFPPRPRKTTWHNNITACIWPHGVPQMTSPVLWGTLRSQEKHPRPSMGLLNPAPTSRPSCPGDLKTLKTFQNTTSASNPEHFPEAASRATCILASRHFYDSYAQLYTLWQPPPSLSATVTRFGNLHLHFRRQLHTLATSTFVCGNGYTLWYRPPSTSTTVTHFSNEICISPHA